MGPIQDFLACVFLALLGISAAYLFVTGQLKEGTCV